MAVARHGEEFFAVEDECCTPRSRSPRATSSDCTIECWLHGSRFDLRTGKPTGLPATDPFPAFPVRRATATTCSSTSSTP